MFRILAKFFRFSGRENGNKFKLSIVIGLIEALASAMKIPAIMYILIGLLSGKPTGKYIGGSVAIMVLAIVVDVICKRYSTVLQTEGGYNASAFLRIKIAEHLRYLPMGYFNSNSIGEISSITTNTMEICSQQDTNISPATNVCPDVVKYLAMPFLHTLSGPFDTLRSARLTPSRTLCKCTTIVISASTVLN